MRRNHCGVGHHQHGDPPTILLNDEKTPCFSDSSVIDTHVFYSSQSATQTVNLPTATPSAATFTLSDPADHTRPTWLTFDASTPSLTVAANATAADSVCYTLTASNTANSVTHTATRTACVAVVADVCSSATGWHPKGQTGPAITPNAGLTKDCNILMAAKPTLNGTTTTLDWATDKRLWNNSGDAQAKWEGIFDGTADGVDWFTLQFQHLNGTIPGVLGGLTGPTRLSLTRNNTAGSGSLTPGDLSGVIPKELGSLTSLTHLLLRQNKFSGPIPPELGNLTELTSLSLYGVLGTPQFSGAPPSELSQLTKLTYLHLGNNSLTGPIPEWLGKLTALTHLNLIANQLTGKIPKVLGTLTNLTNLRLDGNFLTGGIPKVTYLWLFHNDSVCLPEIPADTTDTTYADINALHTWYNALQDAGKDAVEVHCVHTALPAPRATLSGGAVTVSWSAYTFADTTHTTSHYEVLYQRNDGYWISPENAIVAASTTTFTLPALPEGSSYKKVRYRALDDIAKANPTDPTRYVGTKWSPAVSATPGGGNDGTTGGGVRPPVDRHGNTPATATSVSVGSRTAGRIDPRGDRDYFRINVPRDGWLVVETTGFTDTLGTLRDAAQPLSAAALALDNDSGIRRNFLIPQRVPAGTYLLAVTGGRAAAVGDYTLAVDLVVGYLDNPQPDSPRSGISVLSGWLCAADSVAFEVDEEYTLEAAYGTERADTAGECDAGETETGFGLLYNWNLLGDGEQIVSLVVDGVALETFPVTVTTLGEEFPRGVTGDITLADFPTPGETARLVWQEAQQSFVLASGPGGGTGTHRDPDRAVLENPRPGSYQSGISVLSGWACEAESVVLEIDGEHRLEASYGTERADTAEKCGDINNGFGLLWNWNLLGDGEHTVRLLVDEEEWATATFTVTTLGAEVRRGLTRTATVTDFPSPGETVTLEWQDAQQNFVITGWE